MLTFVISNRCNHLPLIGLPPLVGGKRDKEAFQLRVKVSHELVPVLFCPPADQAGRRRHMAGDDGRVDAEGVGQGHQLDGGEV